MQRSRSAIETNAVWDNWFRSGPKFALFFQLLALVLAGLISLGGWLYYQRLHARATVGERDSLAIVADLKAEDIANWVKERRGDAEVTRSSMLSPGMLAGPTGEKARRDADKRIEIFRQVYGYAAILLVDARGNIILRDPANFAPPSAAFADEIRLALHSQKVTVSDLRPVHPNEKLYLWLACPVFGDLQDTGNPDGAVLLMVDPNTFLFPDLKKWPSTSRTAETTLILPWHGSAICLNESSENVRTSPSSPPPSGAKLPDLSALAASGKEGVFEALDNRGIPVVGALRRIPGTPWLIVAKVHDEEILAPLRRQAWNVGIITGLLMIATTMGISLLWRRQKLEYVRASEARFRTLVENAPVAVSISRDGRTIYVNQKYLALYGFESREELVGAPIINQWSPEFRELVAERGRRRAAREPVPSEYEGVGQRKDGSQFPVYVAVASVELPDGAANLAFLSDISGRRQAEESLKLFRALLDNANDAIEVIDPATGQFLDINEKASQIHGYSREEYLALKVSDIDPLFTAVPGQGWGDHMAQLRQQGFALIETQHRRKDGSMFPVEINVNYIHLQRDYFLAVVRDITERKRTGQHIRKLNRMYAALSNMNQLIVREKQPRAMLEAACGIAVKGGEFRMAWIGMPDETARFLKPVASAGAVIGYLGTMDIDLKDAERNAGSSALALLTGVHQICNDIRSDPAMKPWREAALQRGYYGSGAFPLKVDGKTVGVFTLYAGEPDFFDPDEINLLDEWAADIGFALEMNQRELRRQEVEQALQASERQFASAFEYAAIGKALVDTGGRFLKVNRALCQMLGYTAAELCAKTFQEITHPDDLVRDVAFMTQILAGEIQTFQMEKRYFHKDGHLVWIHLSVSLVRDEHGQPLHFIPQIQDITERRKIEEQFRQAQKMEAIGQLAGGVAHDFNNILTAIMLQTQVTSVSAHKPTDVHNGLEEINSAAERAANLTRQLLYFSRKQVIQMSDWDLNDVVTNVAKMLQRLIGEDIHLKLHLHPGVLTTHADAGMLDQVLLNLAVNARDAMPQGGDLVIRTFDQTIDRTLAPFDPEARPGHYVGFEIVDTGSGISPEVIDRIFEPFFTTKEPGKGTGLGLATVFGIVKQHRGFLKVDSEVGKGSKFQVFLPAGEGAVQARGLVTPAVVRGGTETVLLVEDEDRVRLLAREFLEQYGYKVIECENGAEALERWKEIRGGVDIVLTDMVMPGGVSGKDLAERLRQEDPKLKVIFTSGYSAEVAGRKIELKYGEVFLAKPFRPEKLLEILRQCLDG